VRYLCSCVVSLIGKTPAQGAVPLVFCATSAEVAANPGAVWTQGPRPKLMPLKPYFAQSSDAAWAAINAAIRATGRDTL
jgi:hypothetical protein